jgi:hypothetical protein
VLGWALAFMRRVEQLAGIKPLLYSNPSILAAHSAFGYPSLGDYGLWLAQYPNVPDLASPPPSPAPWSEIAFWQYSSTGSVPGIAGDVDLDLFTGGGDIGRYGLPASVSPASSEAPKAEDSASAPSPADDPGAWISALAYLADDVAAIEDRDQRLAEARRVRLQFVGPKSGE